MPWKLGVHLINMDLVDNRIARIKQVLNSQHLLTRQQTLEYIKAILSKVW